MAASFIDYLNSINSTKTNLVRSASDPDVEARGIPMFMIMRSLSYHQDAILLVNELNMKSLKDFGLSPQMQYEYLLNVLPKGKRFAKWQKSAKDDAIDIICLLYKYSYKAAKDVVSLLSDDDLRELTELTGGQTK